MAKMKIDCDQKLKLSLVWILALLSLNLHADELNPYELSFRANIIGSHGKPTNDVLGIGISAHRKLSDDWFLGINLDHSASFDFERPGDLLGINTASEVDSVGTMTTITVVGERRYSLDSKNWSGFWSLGGGINQVDLDDVNGPTTGGGTYDIETSSDTELVLVGSAGWIQQLSKQWLVRYTFTYEHHMAEWKFRDTTSGAEDTIDDYYLGGIRIGINYRF
jgi:opacity protein-like surface antigen